VLLILLVATPCAHTHTHTQTLIFPTLWRSKMENPLLFFCIAAKNWSRQSRWPQEDSHICQNGSSQESSLQILHEPFSNGYKRQAKSYVQGTKVCEWFFPRTFVCVVWYFPWDLITCLTQSPSFAKRKLFFLF
jgi:hypothetical protein